MKPVKNEKKDEDWEINKELYIKYNISDILSVEIRHDRLNDAIKQEKLLKESSFIKTNIYNKTKSEVLYDMITNSLINESASNVNYYIDNYIKLYNTMVKKGIIVEIEKKESI